MDRYLQTLNNPVQLNPVQWLLCWKCRDAIYCQSNNNDKFHSYRTISYQNILLSISFSFAFFPLWKCNTHISLLNCTFILNYCRLEKVHNNSCNAMIAGFLSAHLHSKSQSLSHSFWIHRFPFTISKWRMVASGCYMTLYLSYSCFSKYCYYLAISGHSLEIVTLNKRDEQWPQLRCSVKLSK